MSRRIFKNVEIDRFVGSRLSTFESRHGLIVKPPVPIDDIIEDCGLNILYENIEEKAGEAILGSLDIPNKMIIINETYLSLFKEKPGLESFTKAHELGHWDMFADKSGETRTLFNPAADLNGHLYRESSISGNKISVLVSAWADDDIYRVYKVLSTRRDHPNVSSAVDRYASGILMPRDLILSHIKGVDLTAWRELYKIARTFGVTISALRVRLERLQLLYVKDRKIFRSRDEVTGQGAFRFN